MNILCILDLVPLETEMELGIDFTSPGVIGWIAIGILVVVAVVAVAITIKKHTNTKGKD